MQRGIWIGVIVILALVVMPAAAQNCPLIEDQAQAQTADLCADQGPGQVCSGYPTVFFRSAGADDLFSPVAGEFYDVADIAHIASSTEETTWGVTRITTQAYPADSWQIQDATLLVFGNVFVTDLGQDSVNTVTVDVTVTASEGANVRVQPDTEYRVLKPLFAGDVIKATGLTPDTFWLRVQTRDGETGWMVASSVSDDLSALPTVEANDDAPSLLYRPMQRFSFESGLTDARCDAAPNSGIVVQTAPEGPGGLFNINGADIALAGTLYVQAQPQGELLVYALEGDVSVAALGTTVNVPAGQMTRVALDDGSGGLLSPTVEPIPSVAYDYVKMLHLPLELLPLPVIVGLDTTTIITPRPESGNSPIEGMLVDEQCKFTVGQGGANLRSGPGTNYPIVGVIGFRESAEPDGRAFGSDGAVWWRIIEGVWIRQDTTVWGGDCVSLPQVETPD